MTAVIGILNKNAVAIAADSAVTVSGSNGRKIYNTANKIFTLSKYHPVAIIIYNSANFITTPWEIIIKIYRKELKEKSFPSLEHYSKDFFDFLKNKNFFSSEEILKDHLDSFLSRLIDDIKRMSFEKALENEEGLINLPENARLDIFKRYFNEILIEEKKVIVNEEKLKDFDSLTKEEFEAIVKDVIDEIFDLDFEEFSDDDTKQNFIDFVYEYTRTKSLWAGSWTGLVFAGYGESEIYPSTISTKVADVFDKKIRFFTETITNISDGNDGSIMPFAQRDVIDTLISGISPEINETLFSTFNKFLKGYNNHIIKLVEESNPELAEQLNSIDIEGICGEFMDEIDEVKRIKNIMPTVDTVSILSKEDLAEMAESLIYLTYLKRRISSDEESVGGPVDVAIISKGDGFIWIKRKHYFEEKYNRNFIKNYFNH